MMFELLERLLGVDTAPTGAPPSSQHHHVAAAALLIEAASVDGSFDSYEHAKIERLLRERLGLDEVTVRALMREAEVAARQSADWHGFTRVLKDHYDAEGRIALLEMLWEVVDNDGRVDDLEASLMRRIPALLYVSDRDNAEARRRARARHGS